VLIDSLCSLLVLADSLAAWLALAEFEIDVLWLSDSDLLVLSEIEIRSF